MAAGPKFTGSLWPIVTVMRDDGERLIGLLLEHQLGIKTITIVDQSFFAPFQ